MSQLITIDDVRGLSVAERILLVEEMWDSISDEPESWSLNPEQQAELKQRIAAHRASPGESFTWDEVKAGLRARS